MNTLIDTNILIDKVARLLSLLEARGTIYFFAFAEREDVDRWDVVLCSEWSDKDSVAAVRFIAKELRSHLEPHEMTMISRIAVIPSSDPRLHELTERLDQIVPQDNLVIPSRMIYGELLGSDIRLAYVFKALHLPAEVPGESLTGTGIHS